MVIMKATAFYIIRRRKDDMYYVSTEEDGQHTFVSHLMYAKKFPNRDAALAQIRRLKNWLGRPKFDIVTGQHIKR